jgi:hypothetical protein
MKRLLIAFMILALVGTVSLAASRTWKSGNGRFSVDAELLDYKDGKAQLKKSDGTVIDVPLASLCDEDRRYVKKQFPGAEEEKLAPGTEYRVWKSKNGKFSASAEFLGCNNGKVQLRKPDGTELEVSKNSLSEADQRWIDAELKRTQGEDNGDKSADKSAGGDSVGQFDGGEIPTKLVRLDPPKGKGRGQTVSMSSYLLSQIAPQQVYVKLGQGDDASQSAFARVVTKEPSYKAPTPIRGVVKFGSREYGFAIDAAGGGKVVGPNRLYFDVNGNGDLTDDKAVSSLMMNSLGRDMIQSQFPRVDVKIESGGKSIDYAFVPSVICRNSGGDAYATVTFYSAAAREACVGEGKNRMTLMLLDHNSNGSYDNIASAKPDGGLAEGDVLLINPKPKKRALNEADLGRDRCFVGKTICVGGQFYEMEVAPSGESLKLTPTKLPTGYVTNSSLNYRAVVFNEKYGAVALVGKKGEKIPIPEGSWRILSYTVEMGSVKTWVTAEFHGPPHPTTVTKGETAELPFGAPLHGAVTAARRDGGRVILSLSILGVGGERCTNLYVNGSRPAKPRFVVKDKDGKEIFKDSFEWG